MQEGEDDTPTSPDEIKVREVDHNNYTEKFFEDGVHYDDKDLLPRDLALKERVFVRYFAHTYQMDIVIHVLHSHNNDADPTDTTSGKHRWSTRIYQRNGAATSHKGMRAFRVLDKQEYPHQIILYEENPEKGQWH